ncbi:MAG: PilZ domain-containing protein [Candidatus Omnitrophica bacterium]|nr:PilZ domain-containing protein [Candidatus Omnitrophota bacterium]
MISNGLHGPERRRHPRLEQTIPLKISSGEVDIVTETKNLSCSGALCHILKFIAPMTKLKVHLLLPLKRNHKTVTKHISCEGVVVRSESAAGQDYFNTAIFFSDISPRDIQIIYEFVESMMQPHESSNN